VDPANIALRLRRILASGILGLALLIPASIVPWPGSAATCAAASTHRVAVVVQHLDGATTSLCVGSGAASITARDALDGSHIGWHGSDSYGGLGQAVCQVQGEPATYDASNCLKSSQPFWALFVARDGGAWQPSGQGISSLTLHGGDAFGLRYQPQVIPLDPPTIAGNCPDPTPPPATPKPTTRPTAPPTARPTATPTRTLPPVPASPGSSGGPTGSPPPSAATPDTSPTNGGVATVTAPPDSSPTATAANASSAPTPAGAADTPAPSGSAPLGLVLVAVAGLAFAALGAIQIRRSR
jgi:hypothetical protein